jgi:hypothetical protein
MPVLEKSESDRALLHLAGNLAPVGKASYDVGVGPPGRVGPWELLDMARKNAIYAPLKQVYNWFFGGKKFCFSGNGKGQATLQPGNTGHIAH